MKGYDADDVIYAALGEENLREMPSDAAFYVSWVAAWAAARLNQLAREADRYYRLWKRAKARSARRRCRRADGR